ncbi:hypothetical protein AURDEDRAFT_165523 [Auricularia subglabra TFB-10046 SS5]|nr:hypothetical protein AURDEDRAFT_165523 [Auricularia subglabra TFB-10046 SS5]
MPTLRAPASRENHDPTTGGCPWPDHKGAAGGNALNRILGDTGETYYVCLKHGRVGVQVNQDMHYRVGPDDISPLPVADLLRRVRVSPAGTSSRPLIPATLPISQEVIQWHKVTLRFIDRGFSVEGFVLSEDELVDIDKQPKRVRDVLHLDEIMPGSLLFHQGKNTWQPVSGLLPTTREPFAHTLDAIHSVADLVHSPLKFDVADAFFAVCHVEPTAADINSFIMESQMSISEGDMRKQKAATEPPAARVPQQYPHVRHAFCKKRVEATPKCNHRESALGGFVCTLAGDSPNRAGPPPPPPFGAQPVAGASRILRVRVVARSGYGVAHTTAHHPAQSASFTFWPSENEAELPSPPDFLPLGASGVPLETRSRGWLGRA